MADNPLRQPYINLDPDSPLSDGEADPFYVDFSPARGDEEDATRMIARRIEDAVRPEKQLLAGHRGCGKSTELLRLKKILEDKDFFVVYVDVEAELDLGDIKFTDVLLSVARGVCEKAQESGLEINEGLLDSVTSWFSEVVQESEERRESGLEAEARAGLGSKSPLVTLLATLTARIKASSQTRVVIRQKLEQRASELISKVNSLVSDFTVRLVNADRKGLVLIVDGLEKIVFRQINGTDTYQNLFVHHAEQLKSVACPMIYTVPISLLTSYNIHQIFTHSTVLPMVKVVEPGSREVHEPGVALLREAIRKRVGDLSLVFEDPSTVDELIAATGGHIRDLFRVVRFALESAYDRVTPRMSTHAIAKLVMEYDRLTRDEDLECLVRVWQDQRIPVGSSTDRLLLNLLVLEYQNGERWGDVHPCVVRTQKFKDALAEQSRLDAARQAARSLPE